MAIQLDEACRRFAEHFGAPPEAGACAPGRVNIIGEHTDYNQGFVLPMAIERDTVILARRRPDMCLNAYAANLERTADADLKHIERQSEEPWMDYVLGVAHEVAALGKPLSGADVLILGDVPIGAGLSSSASLEMAALALFETLGGFRLETPEAAKLGQRVENHFLGVNSGIMDQFIARGAEAGQALFLDCRTLAYELVPVAFPNASFVIADTGISRGLTASKYNERVAECRQAADGLRENRTREAESLRDFSMHDLEAAREALPDAVFRRARHVIAENDRTRAARDAMRAGHIPELGALMNASHESLRADYEVSCPELDALAEIARNLPGCHGARMTGAGFGGCTVNLVDTERVEDFVRDLLSAYKTQTGLDGAVIISNPAQGARGDLI